MYGGVCQTERGLNPFKRFHEPTFNRAPFLHVFNGINTALQTRVFGLKGRQSLAQG